MKININEFANLLRDLADITETSANEQNCSEADADILCAYLLRAAWEAGYAIGKQDCEKKFRSNNKYIPQQQTQARLEL